MNSVTAIRFQNLLRYVDTLEDKPICTYISICSKDVLSKESPQPPRVCPVSSSTNFYQSKTVGIPPHKPQTPPPQKAAANNFSAPWVCTSTSHTWHRWSHPPFVSVDSKAAPELLDPPEKTENLFDVWWSKTGGKQWEKITLLRVIPTMTCWVEVVRWGLSLRIWWEEWRIWKHWFQVSLA